MTDTSASLTKRMRRYQLAFAVSNFACGPAFGGFHSYVTFQIQAIGYAIGHEPGREPGSGCPPRASSCRVPMVGAGDVNLTSFLLYLNAIAYAIAGGLIFLVAGVGDHMAFKREQYVLFLVLYGVLCLPAVGLTSLDVATFNALSGLHVVFAVVGYLSQVWANIFIPYTMREMKGLEPEPRRDRLEGEMERRRDRTARQLRGLRMSIWGFTALNLSLVVFYLVVLGLTHSSSRHAGLSMTTTAGATCVVLALGAWRFLPSPRGKPLPPGTTLLSLPLHAFKDLFATLTRYPQALRFLIAYTIYNDTHFAFGTVTGTLFNLVVRPGVREFTAYSLMGPCVSLIVGLTWVRLYPRCRLTLRHWSMLCYAVASVVALWVILGLSPSSRIGLKSRWEFYLVAMLQSAAGAVIVPLFRVLFSELFPAGNEISYFGFQLFLSCSTSWIPQVVNGPIVDATNNPRVPAAVCLPAFLCAILLAWWTDEERGVAAVEEQQLLKLREGQLTEGGGEGGDS